MKNFKSIFLKKTLILTLCSLIIILVGCSEDNTSTPESNAISSALTTESDGTSSVQDDTPESVILGESETNNNTESISINGDVITIENCYEYFLSPVFMGLSYNWGNEEPNQLFAEDNLLMVKACLDSLYEKKHGMLIYNEDGSVKVEDYIITSNDYFEFDTSALETWLKNSYSYDIDSNTVFMADGLGSIIDICPTKITVENNFVNIEYTITDGAYTTKGSLLLKLTENSYKYVSNYNDFLSIIN